MGRAKAAPGPSLFDGQRLEEELARARDWQPRIPDDRWWDADAFYVDAETTGLDRFKDTPVGWAVKPKARAGDPPRPSAYMPFAHRGGQNLDEGQVRRAMADKLRGKRIINTNTRYDVHMSENDGLDMRGLGCRFHDVAHAAALLDDWRRDFSLESMGRDYAGIGKDKGEGRFQIEGNRIATYPGGFVAPYACRDTDLVAVIDEIQEPLLADQGLMGVAALEDDVIPVVVEMERNGAPIDVELLHRWCDESQRELEEAMWELWRDTGLKINPDSPDDMQRLFKHLRIDLRELPLTATGKPSFTDVVVRKYAAAYPEVARARHAGKLLDLRSKYLLKYRDAVGADGILRFSLHQLMTGEGGTVSGRFACSAVNIQQVMANEKQIREYGSDRYLVRRLFRPDRPGEFWVSADAAQIEYRLFAHYAASPAILGVYGRDPYADYHQTVTDLLAPVRPDFDRKRVKNVNFAQLFGAGLDKTASMLETDPSTAQEFIDVYHRMFPEVRPLLRAAMSIAERRKYVKTLMGRRARFPRAERLHSALNRAIQGSAADINKMVLAAVYAERKTLGFRMLYTVHDELDGAMTDRAKLRLLQEVLDAQRVPLRVPILWGIEAGPNWADVEKQPGLPRWKAAA